MVSLIVVFVNKNYYSKSKYNARSVSKKELKVKYVNIGCGFSAYPMLYNILNKKYKIVEVNDNYDLLVVGAKYNSEAKFDPIPFNNKALKFFYTDEAYLPSLEDQKQYDLMLGFNYLDKDNYIRLPLYYVYYLDKVATSFNRGICNPNKKRFASFLVTNTSSHNPLMNLPFDGVEARNSFFNSLSNYKRVDSGGPHLNNIGKIIKKDFYLSDGETARWLNESKFTISFENQTYDGYMTEKPFLAYVSGTIPIYYGDKSSFKNMNKKAVIYAADFNNEAELIEYVKKVDNDDELYCKIWNKKFIDNPEDNFEIINSKVSNRIYELIDKKIGNNINFN